MRRRVAGVMFCLSLMLPLSGQARAADTGYAVATGAGVVHELDIAASSVLIDGVRYVVAVDADVEIGGSWGAFTMLQPGMRVLFEYELISASERRIVQIEELPPNVVLEQV